MEYQYLYSFISDYLASPLNNNENFKSYLRNLGQQRVNELADFLMMTLPHPRVGYYQSSDYYQIQKGVTGYANQIIDSLGFFPVRMRMDVLKEMETYSQGILFLGLILDIIILLFVILSILLIYSLLEISVESKTFEFGVMRMVGLSKSGIISIIIIQSFMFVIPSVFFGFILSVPTLHGIFNILLTSDMNMDQKPIPNKFAIF
jgi:ABC-type antimicrobial peptide transport system permease subunit